MDEDSYRNLIRPDAGYARHAQVRRRRHRHVALIRRLAEQVANATMDAEADRPCSGGARSQNGYRKSSLATFVGTLTLHFPKLHTGSFFPQDAIERYQRVDRAPVTAVAEKYATGTSTRMVQRAAEKMGVT